MTFQCTFFVLCMPEILSILFLTVTKLAFSSSLVIRGKNECCFVFQVNVMNYIFDMTWTGVLLRQICLSLRGSSVSYQFTCLKDNTCSYNLVPSWETIIFANVVRYSSHSPPLAFQDQRWVCTYEHADKSNRGSRSVITWLCRLLWLLELSRTIARCVE